MATLKLKNKGSGMYPQFPKLKKFFTEFITSFTGADPKERIIYGLKKDDINKNEPNEINVEGNCLLDTLFYLTNKEKCDDNNS